MKEGHLIEAGAEKNVIAEFGAARLVERRGALLLRGGSMLERMEALEWAAVHRPETKVLISPDDEA